MHTLMGSRNESPLVILTRALPPAVIGAMVVQVALVIGGLMIGALLLGMFLDARLGTKPTLTLVLAFVSLPLSVWLTYQIALRTSARARAAYLASKKSETDESAQGDKADTLSAALKVDR